MGLLSLTVTDVSTTCAVVIFRVKVMKMTTAQVVETSVTVNNKGPIQDYVHPDNQTQPTFKMTPGFKPFTDKNFKKLNLMFAFVSLSILSEVVSRALPYLHQAT